MSSDNLETQRKVATEIVALTIVADGVLARRELEALDKHGIPSLLGVSRDALIQAMITHCRALLARPAVTDQVRVVEIERFEGLLDCVTDPHLRETVCRAMLVLSKADGVISLPEQTLLRDALTRWDIRLEEIRV
jgi:hypothetical protein